MDTGLRAQVGSNNMTKPVRGRIYAHGSITAKVIHADGTTEVHVAKVDNRPWWKKLIDFVGGK